MTDMMRIPLFKADDTPLTAEELGEELLKQFYLTMVEEGEVVDPAEYEDNRQIFCRMAQTIIDQSKEAGEDYRKSLN